MLTVCYQIWTIYVCASVLLCILCALCLRGDLTVCMLTADKRLPRAFLLLLLLLLLYLFPINFHTLRPLRFPSLSFYFLPYLTFSFFSSSPLMSWLFLPLLPLSSSSPIIVFSSDTFSSFPSAALCPSECFVVICTAVSGSLGMHCVVPSSPPLERNSTCLMIKVVCVC